jgi:hypothetical protein
MPKQNEEDYDDEREDNDDDDDNDEPEATAPSAARKEGGKVLDLFDMEIPTPSLVTTPNLPKIAMREREREPPSIDSATVQQVVSTIHKEQQQQQLVADDMTVGMTELQGVLNDGGTIDAKLKPKPFLPTTFKKQAAGGGGGSVVSKSTTNNHNNNVKKIVVKYSGSEAAAAAAAAKKKKKPQRLPPMLIEDADEADSTEALF